MGSSGVDPFIELEIPARAEYVGLARLVVSSLASARRTLAEDRIDDLKLAVSEACTNAIEAQADAVVDERVTLRWSEGDDRLQVQVEDHGQGFDPGNLPEHPPVTDPDRLNFERGLGIPLIRTLVDEVAFDPSTGGTSVRMVMFCGPADDLDGSVQTVALKKALKRLTTPVSELDRDRLRQFCSQIEGTTCIGDVQPRAEVTVAGEIANVRIVPRPDGSSWLEATVKDGTGSLVVMWTGRTHIAGIAAGRRLIITGRGAPKGRGGRLLVTNPRYELLA